MTQQRTKTPEWAQSHRLGNATRVDRYPREECWDSQEKGLPDFWFGSFQVRPEILERMGIVPAKASAEWHGDIRSGTGTFAAGDSISGGVTNRSRFEGGPGSNPEQLLGAAHASCFSMELASYLDKSGTPAQRIRTNAEVTVRFVEGTPTITKIDLFTVGAVPGMDKVSFEEHAMKAKANCPVSRALSGVPEVTLEATLEWPPPSGWV